MGQIIKVIACGLLMVMVSGITVEAQKKDPKKKDIKQEAEKLLEKQRQVEAEREALKALYWATNGDEWETIANWLSDKPITDWFGVNRNYDTGKLSIYLGNNGLKGELPPQLFTLSTLRILNLCNNQLSGSIPSEIGQC